MTDTALERAQALEHLHEILKPGDTVYTVLRHLSSSGQTRWIDCYVIRDSEPMCVSWWVAKATGRQVNRGHDGVKCVGSGMDMGFDLVYSLSRSMFPDGFDCIAPEASGGRRGCPSNDHVNYRASEGQPCPKHHSEGGYAISQRWL